MEEKATDEEEWPAKHCCQRRRGVADVVIMQNKEQIID